VNVALGYDSEDQPAPRVLGGRWELVSLLARGGMGTLYVGRHLQTGRRAALKVIDRATPDSLARFRVEASVAAQLNHPGIVDVFDADMDAESGCCFIAMELLDGCTLRQVMDDAHSTPQHVIDLLISALEPLAAAHEKGFVHRDLKPENLFVLKQPVSGLHVKVLDFGIVSRQTDERLTRAGTAMGTPHYMSPEQATSARDAGPASDIWSLGVMMYEAIRGEVPFDGETGNAIIVKACTSPHMPLDAVIPDVDPAIARLIDRCLAKQPGDRPQSAQALLIELKALIRPNSLPASRPSLPARAPVILQNTAEDTGSYVRPSLRTQTVANSANLLAASGLVCSLGAIALPLTGLAAPAAALIFAAVGGGLLIGAGSRMRQLRELLKPQVSAPLPKPTLEIARSARPKRLLHPTRGPETARIKIELYGDLSCAITRRAYQRVMSLRLAHPEDIQLTWRPYWDPERENAPLTAEVARALFEREGAQTFWAFFDRMLVTTRKITSDFLLAEVAEVINDMHGLRRALRTRVHKSSLFGCREEAESIGIDASPTFVINGVMLVGEQSDDRLHWAYVDAKSALEARRRVEMSDTRAGVDQPPLRASVRGLLIRYRGARNAPAGLSRSRAQALERASKLLGRAKMEGADFADVALRFADHLLEPDELAPRLLDHAFADATATLRVGELSQPIECDEGFLVVQRLS
jgi:serine/threonine protein kinase/predicted DsbA family dithiol-disulfide isomerase